MLLFTCTVFAMDHKISCDPLQAAWAAIQVYLELDRAPASAANAANAQSAADAKLSPEELKKLKQKRRKVRSHICPDGHHQWPVIFTWHQCLVGMPCPLNAW